MPRSRRSGGRDVQPSSAGPGWSPSSPAPRSQLTLGFHPAGRKSLGAGHACPVDEGATPQPAPALTIPLSWPRLWPWGHICGNMGTAGLPEAGGDAGVSGSPQTPLHKHGGKVPHLGVKRAGSFPHQADLHVALIQTSSRMRRTCGPT